MQEKQYENYRSRVYAIFRSYTSIWEEKKENSTNNNKKINKHKMLTIDYKWKITNITPPLYESQNLMNEVGDTTNLQDDISEQMAGNTNQTFFPWYKMVMFL